METREEQIERLKRNKEAFGLLSGRDQELFNEFRSDKFKHIECFDGDRFLGDFEFKAECYSMYVYRIKQDYKEEPEPEKYLRFDIDWDFDMQRGGFTAYSRDYELTCMLSTKSFKDFNGNKYKFKHFEFDLPKGGITCNLNECLMYKKEFNTLTHVCNQNKADEHKTIFANRIVFERCCDET